MRLSTIDPVVVRIKQPDYLHGVYLGPIAKLAGKTAMLLPSAGPGREAKVGHLYAQFDDRALDESAENLEQAVAHGWKAYPETDFILDAETFWDLRLAA